MRHNEWRDEVAYYCAVHKEANLKVVWGTAPFRQRDSDDRKRAWLAQYKDRITEAYQEASTRNIVSIKVG